MTRRIRCRFVLRFGKKYSSWPLTCRSFPRIGAESGGCSQRAETAQTRKSQVGTGDRSERIRTYNFPQGRMTDHRIGLTLHKLDFIMNGDLSEMIDALTAADQSERLKQAD